MLSIFLTGDNHFGREYEHSEYTPEVRERLRESRFLSLEDAVNAANRDDADIFAVSGDLFDRINVGRRTVGRVVDILSHFDGQVLVLPGNHDFYSGSEEVWTNFEVCTAENDRIILLKECRPYEVKTDAGNVVVYPAPCNGKHSDNNMLGWIKEQTFPDDGAYRIGMAHGAIEGVSPDRERRYFLMTPQELGSIPVDVWLIGHTHIEYPADLSTEKFTSCGKIFNAGTHQPLDKSENCEGSCFEIQLDNGGVTARKVHTGRLAFDTSILKLNASPEDYTCLKDKLLKLVKGHEDDTLFSVTLEGTITPEEYAEREEIYSELRDRCLWFSANDSGLSMIYTEKRIDDEYPETSFANRLLKRLLSDPVEVRMADELLKKSRIN
ncbi:MAG: metallophosphoesterase family protein [Oscillospiraceae bacterium]|jgi:exonuclease SbcD